MGEKKCEQRSRMVDTRVKVETVMIETSPPIRDVRVKESEDVKRGWV
jgi:hypothetical protein